MKKTVQCRVCNTFLCENNMHKSSLKKQDWICKKCKNEEIKNISKNYEYKKETNKYTIDKSDRDISPRIKLKDDIIIDSGELIKKVISDTEKYRIDKMLKMLHDSKIKSMVRVKIIYYLLNSLKYIDKEKIIFVINEANRMFNDKEVEPLAIMKLAKDLKSFMNEMVFNGSHDNKKYEDMIGESGIIEVEDINKNIGNEEEIL